MLLRLLVVSLALAVASAVSVDKMGRRTRTLDARVQHGHNVQHKRPTYPPEKIAESTVTLNNDKRDRSFEYSMAHGTLTITPGRTEQELAVKLHLDPVLSPDAYLTQPAPDTSLGLAYTIFTIKDIKYEVKASPAGFGLVQGPADFTIRVVGELGNEGNMLRASIAFPLAKILRKGTAANDEPLNDGVVNPFGFPGYSNAKMPVCPALAEFFLQPLVIDADHTGLLKSLYNLYVEKLTNFERAPRVGRHLLTIKTLIHQFPIKAEYEWARLYTWITSHGTFPDDVKIQNGCSDKGQDAQKRCVTGVLGISTPDYEGLLADQKYWYKAAAWSSPLCRYSSALDN